MARGPWGANAIGAPVGAHASYGCPMGLHQPWGFTGRPWAPQAYKLKAADLKPPLFHCTSRVYLIPDRCSYLVTLHLAWVNFGIQPHPRPNRVPTLLQPRSNPSWQGPNVFAVDSWYSVGFSSHHPFCHCRRKPRMDTVTSSSRYRSVNVDSVSCRQHHNHLLHICGPMAQVLL